MTKSPPEQPKPPQCSIWTLGRLVVAGVLAATAARSARPPRRALRQAVALAPAGRRVACLRALARLCSRAGYRPPLLRLCGRLPRGRASPSRVAVLGRARPCAAQARHPPALPRLRARLCSPSAPLRFAAGFAAPLSPLVALSPALASLRSPSPLVALPAGLRVAPAGAPRRAGWCSRLAGARRPPPAGALAPLRGARGASFLAPAGLWSLCPRKHRTVASHGRPAAVGRVNAPPSSRENKKTHQSGKWCILLTLKFPGA